MLGEYPIDDLLVTGNPVAARLFYYLFNILVSFILINAIVLINVVIAVLLEKCIDSGEGDPEEQAKQEHEAMLKDDTAKWAVAYKSVFSFNLGFGDEAGAKQTIDICGHRGNYSL